MPSQDKLAEFVAWVKQHLTGDEKGEAQLFLERLFQAFGHAGLKEAGATLEMRVTKSAEAGGGTAFADLVWKPVVLVEMKKRGTDLQKHFRQAFDYWTRLVPNRPRYVVLCNFDEFWIYDFDSDLDAPKDMLTLVDLPERWGPLAFLAPGSPAPKFLYDREAVTRQAADRLASLFTRLLKRGVERPLAQRFTLQMLIALFAEDIDLLPRYFVGELLEECTTPADTYDLLGNLFVAMNTDPPTPGGRFKGVRYFNGGLFSEPARVELTGTELVLLRETAKHDWSKVQPEIFGTLFEHSASDPDAAVDERRAFGMHFTRPTDIMKIVGPTIVTPWTEQIEGAKTLTRLHQLLDRLHRFRVLDPACGSGNFLYLAYRELKRLEARIYERIDAEFPSRAEPGQVRLSFLSAQNFFGLDINPLAVEIAKVAMMVARKLAIDELHIAENPLPLDNLDQNFLAADALLTPDGQPAHWPQADVIIGNPPFIGAKMLKPERGPDYVNAVRRAYPDVPGMADYCVYWFRKAHGHLPPCTAANPVAGRAGLVGTQNIRNNQSRVGGLDQVVKDGTIIEAVDNQPWSGEASVHVSIANWVKTQDAALLPKTRKLWFKVEPTAAAKKLRKRGTGPASKEYELEVRECGEINSALSDELDVSQALVLSANEGRCYTGQYPRHNGFWLSREEALKMCSLQADNKEVVLPFMVGADLVTAGEPDRWVIDFQTRSILEAKAYAAPFKRLEEVTLPYIEAKAKAEALKTGKNTGQDQNWLNTWWQHFRPRAELISKLNRLRRYIVCARVTKRPIFAFLDVGIRPDNQLTCFAFEDDYSFGILQSSTHWLWFITKCSKFKSDFRYTPESVFDTFPWPQFEAAPSAVRRGIFVEPSTKNRPSSVGATSSEYAAPHGANSPSASASYKDAAPDGAVLPSPTSRPSRETISRITAVAAAAREVRRVRAEALPKLKGGLRALYRTLELPGANPLKDAHAALDSAVLAAYGFDPKADLLAQLLALNLAVAARIERHEPVTAPGLPPGFPEPETLVTEDCIRPKN